MKIVLVDIFSLLFIILLYFLEVYSYWMFVLCSINDYYYFLLEIIHFIIVLLWLLKPFISSFLLQLVVTFKFFTTLVVYCASTPLFATFIFAK